jgi:integrase/recombinase XerD
MTGKTREKIYENEHDAVNDFIERKQAMGRSRRTLNAYSRTLKSFFHEEFPDVLPTEAYVPAVGHALRRVCLYLR